MVKVAAKDVEVAPGDIYEDCAFHPVLCLGVAEGMAWGVSLIDGSQPRSCDLRMCGIRVLSLAEAWHIKQNGPTDPESLAGIPEEDRWWR